MTNTAIDGREIPTARAITERIVKIRSLAKDALKSSPSKSCSSANSSTTNTPSKAGSKRKLIKAEDDAEGEDAVPESPSKKPRARATRKVKPVSKLTTGAEESHTDEEKEEEEDTEQATIKTESDYHGGASSGSEGEWLE